MLGVMVSPPTSSVDQFMTKIILSLQILTLVSTQVMCLWRAVFLAHMLVVVTSSNILVTAPFSGSHLTSIWDVAVVLADNGHNVTFISLEKGSLDNLNHPNITGYIMRDDVWEKDALGNIMHDLCTAPASLEFSDHMHENTGKLQGCVDAWAQAYAKSSKAYRSSEFESILDDTKFDMIVSEKSEFMYLTVIAASRKIPTVCYNPSSSNLPAVLHGNYPLLPSSHPGIIFETDLDEKPSFARRLRKFLGSVRTIAYQHGPRKYLQHNLDKYGVTSEEAKSTTQLFLINDHIAFSYPYFLPPFALSVGAMKYLDYEPKPLPYSLQRFVESGAGSLIYISFGTYLEPNYKWTQVLFSALGKMNVEVILKLKNTSVSLPKNFMAMGWVPQVDLLASSKLDLFISHCGNNGRIESSYYKVPVLCVPLFADQLLNSEIIKFKKFGDSLLKEEIVDEKTVIDKVEYMLESKNKFKSNLEAMSYIVKNDPARAKDKLLFYVDYLEKFGNLDFLHNHILRKQYFWEIYNLDIFGFILTSICAILFITITIIVSVCQKKSVNGSKKQN